MNHNKSTKRKHRYIDYDYENYYDIPFNQQEDLDIKKLLDKNLIGSSVLFKDNSIRKPV